MLCCRPGGHAHGRKVHGTAGLAVFERLLPRGSQGTTRRGAPWSRRMSVAGASLPRASLAVGSIGSRTFFCSSNRLGGENGLRQAEKPKRAFEQFAELHQVPAAVAAILEIQRSERDTCQQLCVAQKRRWTVALVTLAVRRSSRQRGFQLPTDRPPVGYSPKRAPSPAHDNDQ